jgi:hypothetical protein
MRRRAVESMVSAPAMTRLAIQQVPLSPGPYELGVHKESCCSPRLEAISWKLLAM